MSGFGDLLLLVLGLAALLGGVELILDSSAFIANRLHLHPFIYGLTVVALVTNLPELGTNSFYALRGNGEAVIGNVLGSNVFNVLAVLGFAAAFGSLEFEARALRQNLPHLLLFPLCLAAISWDHVLTLGDGVILLMAGTGWMIFLVHRVPEGEGESVTTKAQSILGNSRVPRSWKVAIGQMVTGLVAVAVGSWAVVVWGELLEVSTGALAQAFAQRPTLFGLTLLAVWTSLPELALAIMGALRGDRELLGGVILGSCVLNLTLVAGVSAVMADGIHVGPSYLRGALPLATISCLSALGLGFLRRPVSRVMGVSLVVAYLGFLAWLVLDAAGRPTARIFFWGVVGASVAVALSPALLPRRYVTRA